MIYNNNDVLEHINALREAFEMVAEAGGYSVADLTSIRNRVVEERGKHGCDWDDPEEKIAFDYYYCIEQYNRLEEEGDLSPKIRLRLFRFATMNKHVKELWDQAPYFDPKAFLNEEQLREKVWRPKFGKRGVRR